MILLGVVWYGGMEKWYTKILILSGLGSWGMVVTAILGWHVAAAAVPRTFTYHRFHIPRAPTAPAMAPAARARPGGLGVKLAGPE